MQVYAGECMHCHANEVVLRFALKVSPTAQRQEVASCPRALRPVVPSTGALSRPALPDDAGYACSGSRLWLDSRKSPGRFSRPD